MECYYHPDREGTDQCAICGKSICKECGLEIAGKVYCAECLEKIVGIGIENNANQQTETVEVEPIQEIEPEIIEEAEPIQTEPVQEIEPVIEESIYQPQDEEIDFEIPYAPQEPNQMSSGISEDSPYNIKDNIEYDGGIETSYANDAEIYQKPQVEQEPQITQPQEQLLTPRDTDDFIYPDHSYEPEPTSARLELEDKYEKYLDDLYFEEKNEIPLNEQLAKDEEQYGSLTRREYAPRPTEAVDQQPPTKRKSRKVETPEEMEARIRAEILKEQGLLKDDDDKNIHNLNYQEEKESMGVVDILLTIILIIVILIVIYYLIYLFILTANYPTFMDAVFALRNPQNVINNLLTFNQ